MAEPKIGVFVCNCGTNIAKTVDCEAVCAHVRGTHPGVAVAKTYKYMCSNPGQEMITQDIREHGLDRVVVAACSPRMHERTFRKALATGGLNPYLLEMANIREQVSWVHADPLAATEKAKALTAAAVRRVVHHEPLDRVSVAMCPATLVIGGGIAGMEAALELADSGYPVYLVEREGHLGGNLARVDLTAPYLDSARDLVQERIARVTSHPNISLHLQSEVSALEGYVGNFTAAIRPLASADLAPRASLEGPEACGASEALPLAADGGEPVPFEVGSVVVATGYRPFDASRVIHYGYGKLPDVVTSFEFEAMLKAGRIATHDGRTPKYVAIIHCVGSRSKDWNGYCSRVCCMTALKYAHEVKAALPGTYVSDLYIDMHAFGKGCEDFYRKSSEVKTLFLMYGKNHHPVVRKAGAQDGCGMLIEVDEELSGERIEIPADLIVLMVGMEAREDSGAVARLVNISQDKDGWFIESHPKLDPVATTTEGVFIAGTCAAPKDIPDSIAQARAAAARILGKISKGQIDVDAVYAEVDDDRCSGCRVCNELCPYSAVEYDAERRRSRVISAMCKACGACAAACPSGAIAARHFTDRQIFAQIEGVLA